MDLPVWGCAGVLPGQSQGKCAAVRGPAQRAVLATRGPCSGTLLVPVKRLPQILNQIKDCERVGGGEAETDANTQGVGEAARRRAAIQLLERGDAPPITTTAYLPQGCLWGSPSLPLPPSLPSPVSVPVPPHPTLLIARHSRESVSGLGISEHSRDGLTGSWDFSPGGLSGVLSWTPGACPLV